MSADRSSTHAPGRRSVPGDRTSRRWVEQLHADHPRHDLLLQLKAAESHAERPANPPPRGHRAAAASLCPAR